MRTGKIATIVAATAMFGAGIVAPQAQAPRSYTWYAELVSVDQSAKALTVKVQIRDGVTTYAGTYKPGDKLMLTWTPVKNESDTVIYAPKYEVMKGIDEGYILPADFVSADPSSHSLIVKIAASDAVLQGVRAVQPGQWIKVVAPMLQSKEVAALTSAAASAKPDLKPPPPPPAAPATTGMGRGRGGAPAAGAPAAGAGGSVAGTWTVTAQVGGNALSNECVFALQGPKISGTCKGPMGAADVQGELTGNDIQFGYSVTVQGVGLDFAYTGTVDLAANTMKGSVSFYGMTAEFSGTKK